LVSISHGSNSAAMVHSLRHPHAPAIVDVDVRRLEAEGRFGPERDFEAVRHDELAGEITRAGGEARAREARAED